MKALAAGGGGLAAAAAATLIAVFGAGTAQTKPHHWPPPPHGVDKDTARMLKEISADRIEHTVRTLVSFGNRSTISTQDDPTFGIGAARDWLKSEFDKIAATSGGRMTVALDSYDQPPASRIPTTTKITDVVATLKGTQPESAARTYVISGHYDSRCTDVLDVQCFAPGADDDASGVATVLELARVMATRQFDATIVFMAVAGEEQGLYGSNHFADEAKAAGTDIQGMLNNDIVGGTRGDNGISRPNVIRLFAEGVPTSETAQQASTRRSVGGENDSTSRQLARYIESVTEPMLHHVDVQIMYRRDRFLRSGDQVPFLENGYPAVRFTEPDEDYTHEHQNVRVEDGIQYGDLPEFVDYDYIARVTAPVNGLALLNLARGPVAPKRARIITARLNNDTELRWNANPEPDVKGYEIVWRLTDESRWTHVIPVGNVTEYTAKGMAPDNFMFGVRAIDNDGYRSPVSYPVPASR
jgi:hypothetical protein